MSTIYFGEQRSIVISFLFMFSGYCQGERQSPSVRKISSFSFLFVLIDKSCDLVFANSRYMYNGRGVEVVIVRNCRNLKIAV